MTGASADPPDHGPIRIAITNIADNALVHHRILLLHGTVVRPTGAMGRIERTVSVHHQLADGDCRSDSHPVAVRPSGGTFKCLLELHAGPNRLRIASGTDGAELRLCVHYEPCTQATHVVRLLYVTATPENDDDADDATIAAHCRRIELAARLAQTLFAEKLPDRRCFQLAAEPSGGCRPLRCASVSGAELRCLPDGELWSRLGRQLIRAECAQTAGRIKYVAVVAGRRTLSGLGGGDLCVLGTSGAALDAWPQRLADVRAALMGGGGGADGTSSSGGGGRRDGCASAGDGYASAVGALCHEMAHMFGAGHTRHGLMGDGVDYVGRVFCVGTGTVWAPERRVDAAPAVEATDGRRRLTAVRRPATGVRLLQRFREQQDDDDDRTWFEQCSATVLAGSRWMRPGGVQTDDDGHGDVDGEQLLSFDWAERCARSATAALRMVELRRSPDALMLAWWRFEAADGRREFVVPAGGDFEAAAEVFVMDVAGDSRVFARP